MITRAYDASISDVDADERTIVSTINTDAVDRYGTVVDPQGANFENYRRNPVVLYNHDGTSLPIGRNVWIKQQKRRIVAKTRFLPMSLNPTADTVFECYRQGYLNGWSISFDPTDEGPPTPDEIRARPDLANCQRCYRAWDLLEYSCVTIPANPEAVRAAGERGLKLPGWPEIEPPAPAPSLPPLAGRTLAQVRDAVRRQLRTELAGRDLARDILELAKGKV